VIGIVQALLRPEVWGAEVAEPSAGPAPTPSPRGPQVSQAALYEAKLNEAVRLLAKVSYGRCERVAYDPRFWELGVDPKPDNGPMLVLKRGTAPSRAIDEMFASPERWSFDCSQFAEVIQLYALRHSLGTSVFNARAGGLWLRVHDSTGVVRKTYMGRGRKGIPFRRSDGSLDRRRLDDILSSLPVGAGVVWHNSDQDVPDDHPLKNENTIKLGDDKYASHGLGNRNVLSRALVEFELVRHTLRIEPDPVDAIVYIQQNIFVWEVLTYVTPNNP